MIKTAEKLYPIEGHINRDDKYEQIWGGLSWNGMALKITSIHNKGHVDRNTDECFPDFENGIIIFAVISIDAEILLNMFNGHIEINKNDFDEFLENVTGFEVADNLELDT